MMKLGSGTGVSVYRLKRENKSVNGPVKSPWAVKKVNKRAKSNISERLAVEASILKNLNHPNIVGFRAITGTAQGELCLAMEDCEKSLMDLIDERAYLEETFSQEEILKVAFGVAKGLAYLHNEFKILHGDMKSGNVLIRGDFEAVKICDFGVSVKLKDDLSGLKNPTDKYVGSEPWKCKEAFDQKYGAAITDKADVFAYGLVIWEMLTLNVPHVDLLGKYNYDITFVILTFLPIFMAEYQDLYPRRSRSKELENLMFLLSKYLPYASPVCELRILCDLQIFTFALEENNDLLPHKSLLKFVGCSVIGLQI